MSDFAIQGDSRQPAGLAPRSGFHSAEQDSRLKELKSRDIEVKTHEQAHLSASGGAAQGAPKYTFEKGSDGKSYATGGEVNIRIQSGRTPEETLRNAAQVEKAALAPAEPSSQDLQVAATARQMQAQARSELSKQGLGHGNSQAGRASHAYAVAPAPRNGSFEAMG